MSVLDLLMASSVGGGGGGSSGDTYVDDVFSTYLYTGTGSAQTINNGIDLAGKGGMVWIKSRSAATDHKLTDTVRGVTKALISDTTAAQTTDTNGLTTFSSSGFSIGTDSVYNTNAATYASWTFRKAPKFFDVVTWTGTNGGTNLVSHSLGVAPGMIIAKSTSTADNWCVWHRNSGVTTNAITMLNLNTTAAAGSTTASQQSSTQINLNAIADTGANTLNVAGQTYVAYLFAHDTASNGIIQCGSYAGNSGTQSVTLGFEPQWVLVKNVTSAGFDWQIYDTARGMSLTDQLRLYPNTADAENSGGNQINPTSTGFYLADGSGNINATGNTYIYIAIRRPNKPPTSGTQVYNAIARTGTGAAATVAGVGFAPDLSSIKTRNSSGSGGDTIWSDRLRGTPNNLYPNYTQAESAGTTYTSSFDMDGVSLSSAIGGNGSGITFVQHFFKRAPGFFDEVCYTGTGVTGTQAHNLGVVPEMMIIKCRSGVDEWYVGMSPWSGNYVGYMNATFAFFNGYTGYWNGSPTSTVFNLGNNSAVNESGRTYVAYLFATLAGISKVGSYTGNGTTQTINCGFSTGARFVLIKRTDSTGDWYVWDTARGIIAANDPHLSLNSTAAEITTDDSIDPDSTGFIVNQVAATNINVNAATYFFLAIA